MSLIRSFLAILLFSVAALACWQSQPAVVVAHSSDIFGVITLDGRPLKAAKLELHASAHGGTTAFDKYVLQTAVTDREGGFELGSQRPGKYVIVMTEPSYELIHAELMARPAEQKNEELDIQFTGDFCLQVGVKSTH
jgi:hypothetical protein